MSARKQKDLKNINFLRKIFENKAILFGKFSDTLTRSEKRNKWEEIRNYAVATGLVTNDKDYVYVRNITWGNLRKKTLTKTDNSKQTGAGGGKEFIRTEIDVLVLDILGKDSPIIKGLGVADSSDGNNNNVDGCGEAIEVLKKKRKVIVTNSKFTNQQKVQKDINDLKKDINDLKKEKVRLEILQLEMANYKLKLELLQKERELGLTPSQYTSDIETTEENIQNVIFIADDKFLDKTAPVN
ncbi:hypothetical protein ABEB36_009257 [Hypothenemus hampei]|uniref:Regulatory protein zeste n=1 Tax=Hypothenemus hampei TaxID=57062 RepID=A0ABD1EHW1_HYPHA